MTIASQAKLPYEFQRAWRDSPQPPVRRRLRPRDYGRVDVLLIVAALGSASATTWILFSQLTLLSGPFGFFVVCALLFLTYYWISNVFVNGRRVASDRLVAALVALGSMAMFTPLVLLVGFIFVKGVGLLSLHLFTATQKGVPEICLPKLPCPKPGVFHAILGTFEQIAVTVVIGVPAALLTAVYLNEAPGRFASAVRIMVTAMSGVPAILAGAFIYAFWIVSFHRGFSGFAGALALAVILIPTVARGSEEVLRIVPNDLREASTALGAPQWRTVLQVVLPTARSGLVTSILLGVAVALGETAPLLLTIFGNSGTNSNVFNGPQSALPLLIFTGVKSPRQTDIDLAYAAALVLFLLIFIIFISARVLASDWLSRKIRSVRNRRAEDLTPINSLNLED